MVIDFGKEDRRIISASMPNTMADYISGFTAYLDEHYQALEVVTRANHSQISKNYLFNYRTARHLILEKAKELNSPLSVLGNMKAKNAYRDQVSLTRITEMKKRLKRKDTDRPVECCRPQTRCGSNRDGSIRYNICRTPPGTAPQFRRNNRKKWNTTCNACLDYGADKSRVRFGDIDS